MATSNIQYCTHRDIKDTFPRINEFDTKRPIYGWVKEKDDFDSGIDLWYAPNCGLISQLFQNGTEIIESAFPASQKTLLNAASADGASGYVVDSTTGIEVGDIIKVDSQYSTISAVTDSTNIALNPITMFNTQSLDHADDSKLYLVKDISEYDSISYWSWTYDSDMDFCILYVPADNLSISCV